MSNLTDLSHQILKGVGGSTLRDLVSPSFTGTELCGISDYPSVVLTVSDEVAQCTGIFDYPAADVGVSDE